MKGKSIIIVILVLIVLCFVCAGVIWAVWNFWLKNTDIAIPGVNTVVTTDDDEIIPDTDDETNIFRETKTWPSDMPGIVPKFTKGTITSTARIRTEQTAWTVIFANVQKFDMQAYVSKLEASGWETNSVDFNEYVTNTGQKDDYTIIISYNSSDREMSIIVGEESQD